MKINNTSVRGVFLYSPDIEFEYGDFVISGDTIYICKPKNGLSLYGSEPSADLINYEPYLGGSTASLDYSLGYLSGNNRMGSDLYVSALTLQGIMNSFMCGFDEKGIITDYLDLQNGQILTTEKYSQIIGGETQGVLDILLVNRELNNAYLKIGRSLIANDSTLGVVASVLSDGDIDLILRQYSYYDSSRSGNPLTRVQELIDPSQSYVMYRYGVLSSDYRVVESCEFKNSFYSENNIKNVLEKVQDYVNHKDMEYKAKYDAIKGSFRYRSHTSFVNNGGYPGIPGQTVNKSDLPGIDWPDSEEEIVKKRCIVTIVVSEYVQYNGWTKKNHSITVDLFDVFRKTNGYNGDIDYYINDDCIVNTSIDNTGRGIIVSVRSSRGQTPVIEDIYYRYYPE